MALQSLFRLNVLLSSCLHEAPLSNNTLSSLGIGLSNILELSLLQPPPSHFTFT